MKNKLRDFWIDTQRVYKFEWILLTTILCVYFFTMYYGDLSTTYDHGIIFLDSLFSGELTLFYENAYKFSIISCPAYYDILIYIIFAVWALPVWLINKIIPIDFFSIPCLLWFKLLIILFLIMSLNLIMKIGKEMQISTKTAVWLPYVYLTSLFVVLPVFEIGQYDIICTFFILLGVYYYIKSNEKLFLAAFIIAIPLKLFALFLFIPLIAFKEKRILLIGLKMLLGCALVPLSKFMFFRSPELAERSGGFNYMMFKTLLANQLFEDSLQIAIFVLLYGLLCIACYVLSKEKAEKCNNVIYVSFLTYLILFFLMGGCNPYWLVIISPFFILLVFSNSKYLKTNILLETVISGLFVIEEIYQFSWVFGGGETFNDLFLRNMGKRNLGERIHVKYLLDVFDYSELRPAIMGMLFAFIIAFCIINFPGKRITDEETVVERGVMWARLGVLMVYFGITVWVTLIL